MIYFTEDDENIRKLVCYALEKEGFSVKGFDAPSGFWCAVKEAVPELILLDIMLPEENGLSVLQKIRSDKALGNIPVIVLSAKGSEFDKVTGLDMGADDYITKPFGMTELVSRIQAVLRRCRKSTNDEYATGDLYVNPEKHIIRVGNETINLSYKEYSLLLALLKSKGKVVSRDALLAQVWGDFYEESRTLDVHIRKLRIKLKSAGSLIKTVKNIGYKLEEDNER